MRVDYKANGTTGFHCEMTDDVGLVIAVDWSDGVVTASVTPDGLPAQAAVAAVERYAGHEYERRRTRSADKRAHHEKEAATWLEVAKDVGELIGDLSKETEHGWCSDCLTKAEHRLAATRTKFRVRRYVCTECGSPTGRCDVPKCRNFADRGGGPKERSRFCAEHGHDIPSFEKLTAPVDSLDAYVPWLDFERINAKRFGTVAAISVVGVAVLGPLTYVAAPALGGALGSTAGLTGAAATNHGLAVLGGGSLAAGGLGMAGGTVVLTAAGASLGGAAGASVASAYVRSDKSFAFEQLVDGDDTTVIFANGFLSEGKNGWGDWRRIIGGRYPDATVYRLQWGAKELKSFGNLIPTSATPVTAKAAAGIAAKATASAGQKINPIGAALAVAGAAKNPWHVARTRATMTGAVLADAIVRADLRNVVLVGFSLGGRVMAAAAEALASQQAHDPRLDSIHLLGAAAGTRRDWRSIEPAVDGVIHNYHSKNDRILSALYRVAEAGTKAIGCDGIPTRSPKIKIINVAASVKSHHDHLRTVSLR